MISRSPRDSRSSGCWFARLRRAALSVLLAAAILPAQASLEITSVPVFGTAGSIHGRVSGVDFATHRVAVFIQIEGSGWWTKPGFQMPSVAIRGDGSFSASVYTSNLDDRATIFAAALLGPGVSPPLASGSSRIPAALQALDLDIVERPGRVVQFAGRSWAVKDAPVPVGPGGNRFSTDPTDVWVDALGRLHLRMRFRDGRWWGAEVFSLEKFGFGTFWFTTESELEDLDPDLVFGAFTWDPFGDEETVPGSLHREIDFEDSRWGDALASTTSQVVVQPYDVPGNLRRFTVPDLRGAPTLTRFFSWEADRIEFLAARGRHGIASIPARDVLHRSSYLHASTTGARVPTRGRTRWHFNLWSLGGNGPRNGQVAEVIVSDFRYSPVVGAFPAGCGVNPRGSLRPTLGSTSVGRALFVEVDNPAGTQPPGALAALMLGAAADPLFPCGRLLPGFGMAGPVGELQVDLAAGLVTVAAGRPFAGGPVPILVSIPADPRLVDQAVYLQGALVDPRPGALRPVTITDAVQLQIRR